MLLANAIAFFSIALTAVDFAAGFQFRRGISVVQSPTVVPFIRSKSVSLRRTMGKGLNGIRISNLHMSTRCNDYAEYLRTKPRWGGPVLGPLFRYINNCFVSSVFFILLRVFNKFRCTRRSELLQHMFHRPKGRGLLTVSNHQSVMDDPGLWSAFLPMWRSRPEQVRWVLCTEDVFFAKKWMQRLLAAGNVLPLDRSGSLEQPLFRRFQEKLSDGSWCHIFAEGRVWQSWRFNETSQPVLGPFKYGVGKLIAQSYPNVPIVLPCYHRGMDKVVPEKVVKTRRNKPSTPISIIPRVGNQVEFYVGSPMNFTDKIAAFEEEHPGVLGKWNSTLDTISLYESITNDIRKQVLVLESEAYGRNSSGCSTR